MISRIGNCTIGMSVSVSMDGRDEPTGVESIGLHGEKVDERCDSSQDKEVDTSKISVESNSLRATCLVTECPFRRVEG